MRAAPVHVMVATSLVGVALGLTALAMGAASGEGTLQATPSTDLTAMAAPIQRPSAERARPLDLDRPDDEPARLKIAFNDDDAVRLLPDGRVFSMSGRDVTPIQRVLDTNAVNLVSAVNMPESKVTEIRASFQRRTGRSMEDIGSTMWLDGAPEAVDRAASQLRDEGRLRMAAFSPLPAGNTHAANPRASSAPSRPAPTRATTPPPTPMDFDFGLNIPEIPVPPQPPHVGQPPVFDLRSAMKDHPAMLEDRIQRAQRRARAYNSEQAQQRGGLRGTPVYCCVFTLTGDPGEEVWNKRCEGSLGDMTADACDDLNIDGFAVAFVRNEWTGPGDPTNDCFTNCLDNAVPANNYGACCNAPGTRAGEDMLQNECTDAGGDFQGATVDPSQYLAWANCDACPQVWGACCFEAVNTEFTAFIWDNTGPIWEKTVCNGEFPETQIQEPTVEPFRMRSPAANFYTGWTATIDDLSAGWSWQDPDGPPPQMMNPSVIVNTRLISNSNEETACERCIAAGGFYAGNGTQPQTTVWEDLGGLVIVCGQALGITDCDTGATDLTNVLGGCCVAGEPSITTQAACFDAADDADQNRFACWQLNMLLPPDSLTQDPEGTDIHMGYWRPWWIMTFTPPSAGTYAVPDIYDWFVPFWEYFGDYTPWTGWDSGRWWDEGFQPNLAPPGQPATTRDQFTQIIFPEFSIASALMPAFPVDDDGSVDPTFINFYRPADYGPCIRFGLPPTCFELVPDYGLPQQPGDWFPWTDPETGAMWPVVPHVNPYVFEMQCIGVQGEGDWPNFFPWEFGRNRWTDDWKFFDIMRNAAENDQLGFSPSYDFSGGMRYLNSDNAGITSWQYVQDGARPNPNPNVPPHDQEYGWLYQPGESGEPTRGSCYYQHTEWFPTIPGTNIQSDFPGDQSCYTGSFCDQAACCDAVALIIPGCCTAGELSEWNSLCVQVALDLVIEHKRFGDEFADWGCTGVSPFMVPEYPGDLPGSGFAGEWSYDSDARNYRLNEYFASTLPTDLQPGTPVPPMLADGTPNPDWPAYRRQVTMAARIAMFAPRCQGIYSTKGQCNVASTESGIGSWAVADADEDLIIGCQDYTCCLRVIGQMLTEKDLAGSVENDFDWIPRKWTQEMADIATGHVDAGGATIASVCYPTSAGTWNLVTQPTPDLFPLQLHMGAESLLESLALADTSPKGSGGDVVRRIGGPDGAAVPAELVELITAPFASTLRESILQPLPQQNIYDVLPDPYYGGAGMALYPAQDGAVFDGDFDSMLKVSQFLETVTGNATGALGRGMQIGVMTESAWLQQNVTTGQGAVHEDLGNILPDPFFDWSERDATTGIYTNRLSLTNARQSARGTAVLGILGATSPTADWVDGPTALTGACHLPYFGGGVPCTNAVSQADCMALQGTWYSGITCASFNDGLDKASVPGVNDFGVRGMAPDAKTWFFPTQTETGSRLEDAFLSAITVLQPGDVLLLAMDPDNFDDPSGCVLLDPIVQNWIEIAQAFDIIVVIPAGDRQVALTFEDLPEGIDLDALAVVGGAVPSGSGDYLRWWSSNYAEADTVAARDNSTVSHCAWGGLVTTTGGNMNLTQTLYTRSVVPPAVPLEQRSYTNDFGSQLSGSIAAAAQTAASLASAQGLTRQVYEDAVFEPASLMTRLYDTAVEAGTDDGVGYQGTAGTTGGQYSWDLLEDDAANYVGRFPQLATLGMDIALLDPPDEDEIATGPPSIATRFDVLIGTLDSGNVFYLRMCDDDLEIEVASAPHGEGPIYPPAGVWLPGPAYHYGYGNAIDVMITFETSGEFNYADVFGVIGQRVGPNRYGMEMPEMFNFTMNHWEPMVVAAVTTPADANPTPIIFTVFEGSDWRDYLNPDPGARSNEIYVRLGYSCADSPYTIEFDCLDLMAIDIPDGGGGG